jgi:hypothetical protein
MDTGVLGHIQQQQCSWRVLQNLHQDTLTVSILVAMATACMYAANNDTDHTNVPGKVDAQYGCTLSCYGVAAPTDGLKQTYAWPFVALVFAG